VAQLLKWQDKPVEAPQRDTQTAIVDWCKFYFTNPASNLARVPPKTTLFHFKSTIDAAWTRLNALSYELHQLKRDTASFDARVHARELISELSEWIMMSMIMLSQEDEAAAIAAWSIGDPIFEKARELAVVGRTLKMTWAEIESAKIPPPSTGSQLALDSVPPLDERSGAWVQARYAADIVHIGTPALANSRVRGIKAPNELYGIDDGNRAWAKATNHSHVWYLRSSLPRSKEK
jgi:hypothetical protein